ncbi:MAG: transglycosylase domain-containing protein, partial [Actinomycetota bacterium]|nr:transglycosylase domain-containing protein [Actinomycetota bacterium]
EGGVVEGGSTITQQYVKNALLLSDRTVDRKVQEASLAFQIEREYSKEEILEFYLNTVYFGAGAYGVEAASQTYFGKPIGEVTLGEAALLAGLIKAPATYNPYKHAEAAVARRSLVIDALLETGRTVPPEGEAARIEPIELVAQDPDTTYPAGYFVEEVKQFIFDEPAFGDTRDERINLLFSGGLTIETTLDPELQRQAEHAVELVLSDPEADPDAAMVTIDPSNGHVLALVGGRDFFDGGSQSKFNLATQGRRPSASSFKPLVLAAAIEEGIGLGTRYDAPPNLEIPITNDVWQVENYGETNGGNVDLVDATVYSYNTAYAQLVMDVGPADAVATARALGVTAPLLAVPSAVLGANDVSPLDMTSAYGTIANQGVHHAPTFVTRVLDADGRTLWEHEPTPTRAVQRATAEAVTAVLQQVVARGTAVNARIGRPVAGKTGTGQGWADAWFVGYTPDLVTGVWVGFAEGQVPMVPPTTRIRVTGGGWPVDIWQLFMTAALAETPIESFPEPSGAVVEVDAPAGGQNVTDTLGMPELLATEILARAGFVVVVESVPDSQYPQGYVVGTEPAAGSLAPGGSEILVLVANGDRLGRVPAVLGKTPSAATRSIERARYAVDIVVQAEDDPDGAAVRAGRVWKVDPRSGTTHTPGDTVTIWVNPGEPIELDDTAPDPAPGSAGSDEGETVAVGELDP